MYNAVIARIATRPIEGADNIVLGTCLGYNVIVGKNTESGALGVFFESGGALSEEFANVHDLVRRKDEDGNAAGGYFEENRRVRAVKMRGVKSEGFWMPISCLEYTGANLTKLKEGDQFDELNGHKLCYKYVTPATARRGASNQAAKRGETFMFRKQPDIDQLRKGIALIPEDAVIYITEKLHGTSARYGYVLDEHKPSLWEKIRAALVRPLGIKTTHKSWTYLNGSKNVILEHQANYSGYYGKEKFRDDAVRNLQLRKGEVLYGELVGYTDTGAPIMSTQSTKGLKDKSISKRYGDTMVYSYGTEQGQCDFYVYRITMCNEDGFATELSWPQVVARCRELGIKRVPEVMSPFVHGEDKDILKIASNVTEDETGCLPSTIDPTHIREGVVVRYESEYGTGFLKHKSFTFGVLEGFLKESDEYVDTEESA